MPSLLLCGYGSAALGMAISIVYFGLHSVRQQRMQRLVLEREVVHHLYARHRMHPVNRKYANAYSSKLIKRRLLNKINQLQPRIHLRTAIPRWQLIHTSSGSVRAVPLP
ncbi:uncharacterized protein LOC125955542 [Anopheles darlingi]|uniref:uncharacterized protein LOC125955542 n=1 Tax=Anopheles darlingi TaxID=43151 RepID=UPI0020FFF600|nr:uncharacterized protein LOC125955542 [Anopheles darlingi]